MLLSPAPLFVSFSSIVYSQLSVLDGHDGELGRAVSPYQPKLPQSLKNPSNTRNTEAASKSGFCIPALFSEPMLFSSASHPCASVGQQVRAQAQVLAPVLVALA